MGLINKVDMVCLSPVGYGVSLTFRALALRRSRRSFPSGITKNMRREVLIICYFVNFCYFPKYRFTPPSLPIKQ